MSDSLIQGKYYYLGRVVKTGYRKNAGGPANDPNNPTGWNTGQWIFVQITQISATPPPGSNRFREGETVGEFWSYGGDDGIVGKPAVGDVVGYFEEPYARVWEKVTTVAA